MAPERSCGRSARSSPRAPAPRWRTTTPTAIAADLPFPPDTARPGCAAGPAAGPAAAVARRCFSVRTVTITLPRRRVRGVDVYVDGRRVRRLGGSRRRVMVDFRGHLGGTVRVRLRVRARGGAFTLVRRYRLCVPGAADGGRRPVS